MNKIEPTAYITYKGYLLHAKDPKVKEHDSPEPLYTRETFEALAEAVRDEVIQKIAEGCILGVTGTVRKRAKNADLSAIIDKILGE